MTRDWLNASEDERRALYALTKRVVDGQFLGNWQRFLEAVFGSGASFGIDFQPNFRKGKVSRKHAHVIARWLVDSQPGFAIQLAAISEPEPHTSWADFLKAHGRVGALRLLRPSEINIIGLAGRSTLPHEQIGIGEEFLLQLTTSLNGEAIGLQQSGGQWFHLPLTDGTRCLNVGAGTNIIPRSSVSGLPTPLCEEADRGTVKFAILVIPGDNRADHDIAGSDAVAAERLDQIATFLTGSGNPFELHALTIRVQ